MAFVNDNTGLSKKTGYFYEDQEISLEKKAGKPTKLIRHQGSWWPDDKKLEAATVYAVVRNWEKTADLVKIDVKSLQKMAQNAWWDEIVIKVIKGKNDELDAKITQTLDKALDLIQDRLDHGEEHYNTKTGSTYRLPVKARDVAVITSVLFDKRQLIRGEPTSRTENLSTEQKLAILKENFEKLAKSKGINTNSEIIEGEAHESSEGEGEGQTTIEGESEVRGSPGVEEAGWVSGSEAFGGQVNEASGMEQGTKEASPSEVVSAFKATPRQSG